MPFFSPAAEGKDASEGIAEDALEGAEWMESLEAVCIFKFLGTDHPQNVPKIEGTEKRGNPCLQWPGSVSHPLFYPLETVKSQSSIKIIHT